MVPLNAEEAVAWRSYVESSWAMLDLLDVELRDSVGISLTWYDVLVHTEDEPAGLSMTGLADRILASKSGLTRVIDRMEEAGLVERRPLPGDRRTVLVAITPAGLELLARARPSHHATIRRHFLDHVDEQGIAALTRALAGVRAHLKTVRPGRIRGPVATGRPSTPRTSPQKPRKRPPRQTEP